MNDKKNMSYELIPFDKEDIDQSLLNIENKQRSNLFTWNGQFSPQFIETMLNRYVGDNDVILDPFVGSGTVLYQSALKNNKCYGIELNMSAYGISRLYQFVNVDIKIREYLLDKIETRLNVLKEFDLEQIKLSLRNMYEEVIDKYERIMIVGFIILLDIDNKVLSDVIILKKWNAFKKQIIELPFVKKEIVTINGDARNIRIRDNEIDFIITSPPYINVYNYHQQYRKSVELLGIDVLEIATSEIGANRKHRSNRFYTVIQYAKDIVLVLLELVRITKKGSRIIFVVGRESKIRGVPISNSKLIYRLATEVLNIKFDKKQERVFKNKYGKMIYEDIIHLINDKEDKFKLEMIMNASVEIASEELKSVITSTNNESVLNDINDAINNASSIKISPIV